MAYSPVTPLAGIQPIAQAATTGTTNHPLGTIVTAFDPTLGQGEFIYLLGVASNIVGALVTYNQLTGLVALSPTTGNKAQSVAVSMNANTSITTGSWYQIGGAAVIKKTAVKISPAVPIFLSATTGRVKAVASAGLQILNAVTINAATVASATSTVTVQIDRPFIQGQIT